MSYIKKRQSVKEWVTTGAICDKCGKRWGTIDKMPNLDGGIDVNVRGWYGGTIDNIGEPLNAVLCDICARQFMADYFPHYGNFVVDKEARKRWVNPK